MNLNNIHDFKPAVSNKILIFLAGFVWLLVGFMLMFLAYSWFIKANNIHINILLMIGILSALVIYKYGFSKIANTNLKRILSKEDKSCLFSFYSWKSYFIVLIMIFLGILLRHSAIPKYDLAVIYTGIGLALALSSTRYFRVMFKNSKFENE